MWLLIIYFAFGGVGSGGKEPLTRFHGFVTQEECEYTKAKLMNGLAVQYPDASVSLTCVQLPKPGRIT
jgi:hypothetical protein